MLAEVEELDEEYQPMNEPSKEIVEQFEGKSNEGSEEMNALFLAEAKENVFRGILNIGQKVLEEYIVIDIEQSTEKLNNSKYLSMFFLNYLPDYVDKIPVPLQAGIITAGHIIPYATLVKKEEVDEAEGETN